MNSFRLTTEFSFDCDSDGDLTCGGVKLNAKTSSISLLEIGLLGLNIVLFEVGDATVLLPL